MDTDHFLGASLSRFPIRFILWATVAVLGEETAMLRATSAFVWNPGAFDPLGVIWSQDWLVTNPVVVLCGLKNGSRRPGALEL